MKLIKMSIISTATISCLLAFSPQAVAQQSELSDRDKYKKLANDLTEAETDCWNAGDVANPEDVYKRYTDARAAFFFETGNKYSDEVWKEMSLSPMLAECPPAKKNKLVLAGADTGHVADIFFGYSTVNPPQAGYGTVISGGETFVAQTDGNLIGFTWGVIVKPKNSPVKVKLTYTDVNGSSEGQVANGTNDVAITLHDRGPSGTTGFFIANRGLDVVTETDYQAFEFEASRPITWTPGMVGTTKVWRANFNFGAGVRVETTEHRAEVTTPTFVDIRFDSVQKTNEKAVFLTAETPFQNSPNLENGGLFISVTPSVEAGYRYANLESSQRNICGLCGPADQDFIINIEDKDSGVYVGANIEAKAEVKVSEKTRIGVRASAWWRNKSARIMNPENGDDLFVRNQPTQLGTDDISGFTFGLTASYTWF